MALALVMVWTSCDFVIEEDDEVTMTPDNQADKKATVDSNGYKNIIKLV